MTLTTIAGGCAASLLSGLIAGRALRNLRGGSALALAIAVTMGLVVLLTARWTDLLRVVQPRVALDWLPLATILFAICSRFESQYHRIACGVVLAVSIPLRLLWDSVYFQIDQRDFWVFLAVAGWALALSVPMFLKQEELIKRASWNTAAWAAATVSTAAIIVSSGSFTYGLATGIVGLAVLGVLIASSTIPATGAIPYFCLIGLSASFAELPPIVAGLLLLVWISVLAADRLPSPKWATLVYAQASAALVLAVALTVSSLTSSVETRGVSQAGTGTAAGPNSSALLQNELDRLSQPVAIESGAANGQTMQTQPATVADPASDPFAGF